MLSLNKILMAGLMGETKPKQVLKHPSTNWKRIKGNNNSGSQKISHSCEFIVYDLGDKFYIFR
jgi:hypothetical protein